MTPVLLAAASESSDSCDQTKGFAEGEVANK